MLSQFSAFAQKNTTHQNLIWYGYYFTQQFNEKWFLQTELQERHFINPLAQHQFIIRTHLHRTFIKTGWDFSAGFCLFLQNPNNPNTAVKLTVPELRPHIEVGYKQKLNKITIDHRFRTEVRFFQQTNSARTSLEDDFEFGNFRMRYKIQATLPIWKIDHNRALKIKASDEILLQTLNKTDLGIFDQNRIYAGLNIDLQPNLSFELGYLNWFQQSSANQFYNRDILRFTVYHTVKWKNDSK